MVGIQRQNAITGGNSVSFLVEFAEGSHSVETEVELAQAVAMAMMLGLCRKT